MGVGRYNTQLLERTPEPQNFSGPAFNYVSQAPPPGVSGNQFDQSAVNWAMAQKYGRERATQNQDIQNAYALALRDWEANAGSPSQRARPNQPALYETNPVALYNNFQTGPAGAVPLQGGRLADFTTSKGAGFDPLQRMFELGSQQPGLPQQPSGASVAPATQPSAQPPRPYQPSPAEQVNDNQPPMPNFGGNLTPQQRATAAATGPQYQPPGAQAGYAAPAAMPQPGYAPQGTPQSWLQDMMAAYQRMGQPAASAISSMQQPPGYGGGFLPSPAVTPRWAAPQPQPGYAPQAQSRAPFSLQRGNWGRRAY